MKVSIVIPCSDEGEVKVVMTMMESRSDIMRVW